jgi:hypothetical protein
VSYYGYALTLLLLLGVLYAGVVVAVNPCVVPAGLTADEVREHCDD